MDIRFKKKTNIFNVVMTALSAMISVGITFYAVALFGVYEAGEEIVLNIFYVACIVMMWLYFFNRISTDHFNYWSSICMGMTVLLRDILFKPPLVTYALQITCLTLSVWLLLMLTYFYARKDWKSYSKGDLWFIFVVDVIIATLYNYDILIDAVDETIPYYLTEIWIRPTITYGLVACFVKETEKS